MTKQQFDKLYLGKAVHCKTEELADEFLELAKQFDYYRDENPYNDYKENTCFRIHDSAVRYWHLNVYISWGFEIVEFESKRPALTDIILNHLDVKVNERFRITRKFGIIYDALFYFDNRLKLNCTNPNLKYDIYIGDLINGEYEIIKLPKPLLTNEEKEFLSNFDFVELEKEYGLVLYIDQCNYHVIDIEHCKHKFNGLEKCKHYTLKELGL